MSKPSLAKLLAEATAKADQERKEKAQVDRITADVQKRLAHLHAADDKAKTVSCPNCGGTIEVSFRTDDVTSETGQNDPDSAQDGAQQHDQSKAAKLKYMARYLAAGNQKQNL